MKVLSKILILIVLPLLLQINQAYGQVTATGANATHITSYIPADTIYIYNQQPKARNGVFTAVSPWGGNATFTWSRYDSISQTFTPISKIDSNVTNSKLDTILGGGYKVSINAGSGKDTSFTFWFYPHKLTMSVLKNTDGYVLYYKYTCEYLDLEAITVTDTFKYFDPNAAIKKRYRLANGFVYNWTADNSDAGTLLSKASFRNYLPPTKNTTFTCTVTDSFSYELSDKVDFIAVRVVAAFVANPEPQVDGKNSAPFKVTFGNNSENALKYTWDMGNGETIAMVTTDSVSSIYKKSGDYTIRLVVERKDCIDSTKDVITVDPAEVENPFPNIFILGGTLETFKPVNISLKEYTFTIFSRWGNKVYEEKNKKENMEGWNGMIGSSKAPEGVYYYLLKAKPFNIITTKFEEVYKGFFYIYYSN